MLCESNTGCLLNFIVYVGANTDYPNAPANLPQAFETYKSLSKVVLSLLHQYLNKGYRVTLDDYCTSPELVKALLLYQTDCYGTLRKKENLPHDFWLWKPKGGDPPKVKFDGDIGVMRWKLCYKNKKGEVCFNDVYVELVELVS